MRVKRIIETLCIEKHLSWVSNTVNNVSSLWQQWRSKWRKSWIFSFEKKRSYRISKNSPIDYEKLMKVLIKNKNWSDQGLWIKKKSFNCILFWNIYSQCRGINFAIPHALFKELYWAMLIKIYSRQNQIIVSLTIPRLGKLNTKKASSCIRRNFWRRYCSLIAFGNGGHIILVL